MSIHREINGETVEQTDRQLDRQTDSWTDIWSDRYTNRQLYTDKQRDGETAEQTEPLHHVYSHS